MPATRDGKTWRCQFYYEDWQGVRHKKNKRGFKTKVEAEEWERNFRQQQRKDLDINFENFVEIYFADVENRLRESTIKNKRYVFDLKVTPYFKKKKMCEIKTSDIRAWQNELIKQGYAPTYLKSINNQLAALFNYAVRYYDLKDNPCRKAGSIGKSKADDMEFWTKQEFKQFLPSMDKKPEARLAFMLLYWTGMRIGDDDDKIRLNQRKPSKYKGLSRFGPEKNLQRINKFMKERPTFYKKLIQMKENFRFYLRCFYCITKVVILQFNSEKQDRISS
jgi:site-specific recombinase XerD